MNKLQLRFMYLVIRFMVKFMLYGTEELRNEDNPGISSLANELIVLGDDIRAKLKE